MRNKRYPEEFKAEAVKRVKERGHAVAEAATLHALDTRLLFGHKTM